MKPQSEKEAAQDRALLDLRKRLCQYISNTGQYPLRIDDFDDDWNPAGDMYREDLVEAGLIDVREPNEAAEEQGGIYLTLAGAALVDD